MYTRYPSPQTRIVNIIREYREQRTKTMSGWGTLNREDNRLKISLPNK
jgi:hypothetical protein